MKDKQKRTYEEQEVEDKQKVLGGRDATFSHFVDSTMERGKKINVKIENINMSQMNMSQMIQNVNQKVIPTFRS